MIPDQDKGDALRERATESLHINRQAVGDVSETALEASSTPSAAQFAAAFRKLTNIKDSYIEILKIHYRAADQTISAVQLAREIGRRHYASVNKAYGTLGRLVREELGPCPDEQRLGTLVTFVKRNGEWHWIMRPEVARSLEILGWVEADDRLPEEVTGPAMVTLAEGAVRQITVNAYERNREARRICIEHYGTNCCICGFNFGATYGAAADGFIHVHHIRPLSEIAGEYVVDPVAGLRPVCPNCHAVLHRRDPAYQIDEVKEFLFERRTARKIGDLGDPA